MVCPRCQCESEAESAICAECGAPLLIGDEPNPSALDRPVVIDRRGPGRGSAPAALELSLPFSPAADRALAEAPPVETAKAVDVSAEAAPGRLAAREDPERALRWRRAAARGVDLVLIALFAAIPLAIAGGLDAAPDADHALLSHAAAFAAILAFVYETLAHYLAGATAGKRLLHLRVVSPCGGSPPLTLSAARAALSVLGAAALGLPVAAALFTRRGRPLHDVVAGTSVVRVP